MRVAYVNWIPRPSAWPGVMEKLRHQAIAARRCGLPWRVMVLSDEGPGEHDGVVHLPIPTVALGGLRRRIARCDLIGRAMDWSQSDRVLLRYPGAADLSLRGFLERHGDRVYSEHHTDEPREMAQIARGPGSWAKWRAECAWGPRWLARVAGIVAVTPEILACKQRRHPPRRGFALGNGICVDEVIPTGSRPCSGELHLLFSCARFWTWQGLDRLLRGMLAYRGPLPIVLHLAGEVCERGEWDLLKQLSDATRIRVITHGLLDRAALDALAATCTVGIGTLALGRKGMRQACTLKSRDYAARGLPFVIAHEDTDLPEGLPGVLRLADGEDPIAIERLVEFAGSVDTATSAGLRAFAAAHLDWSAKLPALHRFLGGG